MKLPGFRRWPTRIFALWATGATVYMASRVFMGVEGAPRNDADPSIPVYTAPAFSGGGGSYGGGHSSYSSGGGSSFFGK